MAKRRRSRRQRDRRRLAWAAGAIAILLWAPAIPAFLAGALGAVLASGSIAQGTAIFAGTAVVLWRVGRRWSRATVMGTSGANKVRLNVRGTPIMFTLIGVPVPRSKQAAARARRRLRRTVKAGDRVSVRVTRSGSARSGVIYKRGVPVHVMVAFRSPFSRFL